MLNEVGRCTSCGEQKLQFRENVNKRTGMCENFVLFCLSCKKDIYSSGRKGKETGDDGH